MRRERRLSQVEARLGRMKLPELLEQRFAAYREDPLGFKHDILGTTSATRRNDGGPYQDEFLGAVVESPRVALISGHGVGKTRALAELALWWLVTRPLSRVLVVAPQMTRQVRGVVFAEIRKLVRRAKGKLPVRVFADRVTVEGYGASWAIVGLPATEPDRIEGQHAEGGLLLIMDETKGVPQESFDALMGALTGGADSRLVIASTPGGQAGPFYKACANEAGRWKVLHVSAEDSSLVDPAWVADRRAEWGEDNPLYQTRVLGEFASEGEGQLFPLTMLERAVVRSTELPAAEGPVTLGVDVARSIDGDANAVAIVQGGVVRSLTTWRSADLMVGVLPRLLNLIALHRPQIIRIDEGGLGGGLVDRLREVGFAVEGVHFGGASTEPQRFKNKRCEMYWGLREALEKNMLVLPEEDEELLADLSAQRFTFDQQGRIVLEPKDAIRRRLGRSPDRSDAVALAAGVLGPRVGQLWGSAIWSSTGSGIEIEEIPSPLQWLYDRPEWAGLPPGDPATWF